MSEIQPLGLSAALPEIFLALAGMLLLIAGVCRKVDAPRFFTGATIVTFLITAALLLGTGWERQESFGYAFVLDQFAGFVKLLILVGLSAVLGLSLQSMKDDAIARFEYPVLVLFAGLGMLMMVSANDLLSLYVGLELQSLSLYVLAAIRRDSVKSSEAGLKYFVLGALSSGMLLFGASLIYGYAGTTNYTVLAQSLGSDAPTGAMIGMVFLLAGIAFKISAVPFHMWTPDVYEGAPTPVTALFAIVPKLAAMALLMRLLFEPLVGMISDWTQILWFLSLASMTLGAFAALLQNNIKRLMAYSSIGNMGYALIGVVAGTESGVASVILYMSIYMAMTAGVFGLILCMRRSGQDVETISDLAGLSRSSPVLAYSMAILMFSMSGIPPLAGFFGKFLVFKAAVDSGFFVLAVLGVLTSVVAAYYYLRIIKVMFFDEPAGGVDSDIAFSRRAVITISVAFVLCFIVSPEPLIDSARAAASALFAG